MVPVSTTSTTIMHQHSHRRNNHPSKASSFVMVLSTTPTTTNDSNSNDNDNDNNTCRRHEGEDGGSSVSSTLLSVDTKKVMMFSSSSCSRPGRQLEGEEKIIEQKPAQLGAPKKATTCRKTNESTIKGNINADTTSRGYSRIIRLDTDDDDDDDNNRSGSPARLRATAVVRFSPVVLEYDNCFCLSEEEAALLWYDRDELQTMHAVFKKQARKEHGRGRVPCTYARALLRTYQACCDLVVELQQQQQQQQPEQQQRADSSCNENDRHHQHVHRDCYAERCSYDYCTAGTPASTTTTNNSSVLNRYDRDTLRNAVETTPAALVGAEQWMMRKERKRNRKLCLQTVLQLQASLSSSSSSSSSSSTFSSSSSSSESSTSSSEESTSPSREKSRHNANAPCSSGATTSCSCGSRDGGGGEERQQQDHHRDDDDTADDEENSDNNVVIAALKIRRACQKVSLCSRLFAQTIAEAHAPPMVVSSSSSSLEEEEDDNSRRRGNNGRMIISYDKETNMARV